MENNSILLVEDDLDIQFALQTLLEGEGFTVHVAANGRVALDLILADLSGRPGLILLDLMMPIMSGAEFLTILEDRHPALLSAIPIFVMSARLDVQKQALRVTGYLQKPLDLEELYCVAKKYAGAPRAQ